jgi:hypothetical protein
LSQQSSALVFSHHPAANLSDAKTFFSSVVLLQGSVCDRVWPEHNLTHCIYNNQLVDFVYQPTAFCFPSAGLNGNTPCGKTTKKYANMPTALCARIVYM